MANPTAKIAKQGAQQLFTKLNWVPQFMPKTPKVLQPTDAFVIDCKSYQKNLTTSAELKDRIDSTFYKLGAVYLINTGISDATQIQKSFEKAMGRGVVYEGGANPRTHIEGNVYDTGVSMESYVHYHHEMAYIDQPVKLLAFFCTHLSQGVDGSTYLSDNIEVTDAIAHTDLGRKLKDKGICYIRRLTDREQYKNIPAVGVYNHWQKSFLTEDPQEAEEKAKQKGLVVEWGPGRYLTTKFYTDSYEYCPQIDRNLLFCSMADHSVWFDTWPLVKELPHEERPLKMTFGDNTEFTDDEVAEFIEIYDRFGIKLPWKVGDAALVCNYRFLHGRPVVHLEKDQVRNLGVVLGDTFKRVGALPDKW